MSERRYYHDAYTTAFAASLVEMTARDGRPAAVLDATYFYPTSGGQPNDTGTLRQDGRLAHVLDVIAEEEHSRVLHILDSELAPGPVEARIDWPRRFDHMQHHTGQHILSQAFIRVAEAETVSFHLSPGTVTIDLDRADLAAGEIQAAEGMANDVIWQARPIVTREVSFDEAATLPLRKVPPGQGGRLRLVEIADFDLTACGGTHVARTAEVGLLKIVKVERRGNQTRVEFCCGMRALADYRRKQDAVGQLTATLTTGLAELPASVAKLLEENKALRAQLKQQQARLVEAEAARLSALASSLGDARLITAVLEADEAELARPLANRLAQEPGTVVLLGSAGGAAQLVFARHPAAPGHMGDALKAALPHLGEARGGGGPASAQGGGPAAGAEQVARALAAAEEQLRRASNAVE
jgi:alanyl-tRNA synthetase